MIHGYDTIYYIYSKNVDLTYSNFSGNTVSGIKSEVTE